MHQSANPWVQTLSAYQPGKSAAVDGLARRPVKLSSNENPRGGAARIAHLLASQSDCDIGRYPDDASALLRAALAGQLGLALDNVLVGSGSSDILSMVAKTFLAPGRVALISSCTFSLYRVIAQAVGADINVVPPDDYGHDLDALVRAAASSHLVLIDNPCNPSGRYLPYASLARFLAGLRSDLPVVIDEAYFEYATQSDYASCIDLIERHPNLLVVRTFSKAHGLAGARLGYCIGHPQLIGLVNRMRAPFNVSVLASQLGIAALSIPELRQQCGRARAPGRRAGRNGHHCSGVGCQLPVPPGAPRRGPTGPVA